MGIGFLNDHSRPWEWGDWENGYFVRLTKLRRPEDVACLIGLDRSEDRVAWGRTSQRLIRP